MIDWKPGTIQGRIFKEVFDKPNTTREATLVQYIKEMIKDGGQASPQAEAVNYSEMKVTELREMCKEKELPIYGKKAELIERLNG